MRERSPTRELIAAVAAVLITLVTGVDQLGKPLRPVILLTLVAGSLVAGVALNRALLRFRERRAAKSPAG